VRARPRPRRAGADQAIAIRLLERMPEAIRDAISEPPEPFAQSHRAKTHFSYRAGSDRIIHLYANPSERLLRALRDREEIRRRATVGGIPRLIATAEAVDAIWIVEELIAGRSPDATAPARWFPAVADWALGMAGPPRRLLADVPTWGEHCDDVVSFTPPSLRPRVATALAAVSHLTAAQMHGDLQRRNVLIDGDRVGAVDWEGAWLEGIPGLDVVFLALFAANAGPDTTILDRLVRGADAPWGALRERLLRLGVDDVMPELVLSMLATWALSERRRRARLGAPPPPAVFEPLYHQFAAAAR